MTTESKNLEVIKNLNGAVLSVLGQKELQGFDKAYAVSNAISTLKSLLTPEYMKPIMELQGSRLGFKTDKDRSKDGGKGPGYSEAIVKDCLIDAVLMGLQPYGNEFNIIAGNMYPTKEGCGSLLNKMQGLDYSIVCKITTIKADKSAAEIEAVIKWTLKGETEKTQLLPIPIKMDAYTSVDALIGKATRKSRAWLISRLSGVEITDGDITDTTFEEVKETITIETLKALYDEKYLKLNDEEAASARRIIESNETNSFKKLFDILNLK